MVDESNEDSFWQYQSLGFYNKCRRIRILIGILGGEFTTLFKPLSRTLLVFRLPVGGVVARSIVRSIRSIAVIPNGCVAMDTALSFAIFFAPTESDSLFMGCKCGDHCFSFIGVGAAGRSGRYERLRPSARPIRNDLSASNRAFSLLL